MFTINDLVKRSSTNGTDAWDTSKYLNIWVCDLDRFGYATYPGNLFTIDHFSATVAPELDGVVIDFTTFGRPGLDARYGLGRTATHEIGHFFNLKHIWVENSVKS